MKEKEMIARGDKCQCLTGLSSERFPYGSKLTYFRSSLSADDHCHEVNSVVKGPRHKTAAPYQPGVKIYESIFLNFHKIEQDFQYL